MGLTITDRQAKIDIIEKWKQSGQSQKEFYQQQNIPAHVFYYWHKCYRNSTARKPITEMVHFFHRKNCKPLTRTTTEF